MDVGLLFIALDVVRQAMAAQMEDGATGAGRAGRRRMVGRLHRPPWPRATMAHLLGHEPARPERGPL